MFLNVFMKTFDENIETKLFKQVSLDNSLGKTKKIILSVADQYNNNRAS